MPADLVNADTIGRKDAVASAGASSVFVYLIFAIGYVGFRAEQIYNFNEAMRNGREDGKGQMAMTEPLKKNESHINVQVQ
jgi:hypothetical protein